MAERPDIVIHDAQVVTQGTINTLSLDLSDRGGESFSVVSGTVSIFSDIGTATAIVDKTVNIGTAPSGKVRVSVTLSDTETAALEAGPYNARWRILFGDGQTRIGRQAVRVREEDY